MALPLVRQCGRADPEGKGLRVSELAPPLLSLALWREGLTPGQHNRAGPDGVSGGELALFLAGCKVAWVLETGPCPSPPVAGGRAEVPCLSTPACARESWPWRCGFRRAGPTPPWLVLPLGIRAGPTSCRLWHLHELFLPPSPPLQCWGAGPGPGGVGAGE